MDLRGGPGRRLRLGVLATVFTPELVDAVIAEHGRGERRRRILPARLVVYFVLALCLFARESYEEVVRLLATGLPGTTALRRVNKSSLCRARARLGAEPLESLFRSIAGTLATPETPGAFWCGLRLLAIDGTQIDVPDSHSNATTFDGPCLQDRTPTGFPQVRAVVLAEVGTHAVVDAEIGGWRDGEPGLAEPLARSVGPDDLVIADRGFWSSAFYRDFHAVQGAHLLARLPSNKLGRKQHDLPDGTFISEIRPRKQNMLRAKKAGRPFPTEMVFRVIPFAVDGKPWWLATTLLDPKQHPAVELVNLYRQRWEIEMAFDEIKNHLGVSGPLRSRTADGIRQEIWAFLAVHHALRKVMHTAATSGPAVDPDRVSYLAAVRVIRRTVVAQVAATAVGLQHALVEVCEELRHRLLPARRRREQPRMVKKPPSRFPQKRSRSGMTKAEVGRWHGSKKPKSARSATTAAPG
ncbi:IS4 family transposase [Kitasatospora aureofaciens]|uniref:IS4 family transposase n=1 Tax=Kitasatospora aureofaciens TaxID=1894 RepID=UPI001C43AFF6|nr:IS4 family transposase [Kitasatospora aureofaciens]MBV6700219.1 IS4 family transposase [Kitasatospora aureofaciens]